jgi:hypothetical protein
MSDPANTPDPEKYTRSQQLFLDAPEEYQKLVRDILREEREVMHLLRRPEIHQKIVNLVRRHIA